MSLNSSIDALVTEIKAFAIAQSVTEKRAFQVALTRLCKRWAIGQTVARSELVVVMEAFEKLSERRDTLANLNLNAMSAVAAAHQSEVDAIVAGTTIPE